MKEPYRPPPSLSRYLLEALKVALLCGLLVALNEIVRPYYCAHVTSTAEGFPAVVCGG